MIDADKLRYIARSLDILTGFVRPILEADLVTVDGKPIAQADRDTLLEWVNGTEQQNDLTAWADALDAQPSGSGGSVEADVETLQDGLQAELDGAQQVLDRFGDRLPVHPVELDRLLAARGAKAKAEAMLQALTNLTDRIDAYKAERDAARAVMNLPFDEAQARIHYLEGRVGELEPALREWLEAEQDISGRPDKGWETEAAGRRTQRLIAAKAAATRALSPPMKGPNDD